VTRLLGWCFACIPIVGSIIPSTARAQIENPSNQRAWLVRYHENDGHPVRGDIALRLHLVEGNDNEELVGQLTRYDDVFNDNGTQRYKKREDCPALIQLRGRYSHNSDKGKQKKKDLFVLAGSYHEEDGTPHIVTVRGYYGTGNLKNTGGMSAADQRKDDRLCIRLIDQIIDLEGVTRIRVARSSLDEPCDQQPPDEDVLTEDDSPPSPDPEYDG
jgi:hypothetical protein